MATLGAELKRLRLLKGVTLRQVETDTKVSNAYLSQLENEKAEQPSPRVLHKLADYYGTPYPQLMQLAGYLFTSNNADGNLNAANRPLLGNLTPDEETFLNAVLEAYRANKAAEGKQ